jgi:hypothetical protein
MLCLLLGMMRGMMVTSDQRRMGLYTGISMAESMGLDGEMARDIASSVFEWRQLNRDPFDGMMG